jgi:amidase/6-aminohexanoate-cyclic-dimer hydrolase
MAPIDEYTRLDAHDLAAAIARGDISPAEALEAAIARAGEVEARINSIVIPMFEEARATVAAGLPSGPFRGVPFLLKDLGLYYAGVPTTGGCRFFSDYVPDHDTELVRRYKAAGLSIFGKSASPEFGLTTTTESLLFGITRNPWNLDRTAGGSSGGAAAAVAAGIVPFANASDGGGSIRIPAACCGLFGLKPTRARVPLGPDVAEGWSGLSTVHAVSRSVRDSAALLDATAGAMAGDPYWAPPPQRPWAEELGADAGRLRIAFTTTAFNGADTDPECAAAVTDVARLCEQLGHHVEEAAPAIDAEKLGVATGTIVGSNILANLRQRAEVVGREHTQDDVEPLTWSMAEHAKESGASDYALAIRTVHATGRRVGEFFGKWDLLLSPTMPGLPKPIGVLSLSTQKREEYMPHLLETIGYTQLMNVAGNPAMSVPLAWSQDDLPIGIQFAADLGDEATLFRLAAQLEEARPWADRRPSL